MIKPKPERCACGQPLHYGRALEQKLVEREIAKLGPTMPVEVSGLGKWDVPRHYIALHGIVASEMPEIARRYGFPELPIEEG